MSPRAKTILAIAIGCAGIVLSIVNGRTAPSLTYTGAAIYWLSYAFVIPAVAAGVTWLIQRKKLHRSSSTANTFLIFTVLLFVATVVSTLKVSLSSPN